MSDPIEKALVDAAIKMMVDGPERSAAQEAFRQARNTLALERLDREHPGLVAEFKQAYAASRQASKRYYDMRERLCDTIGWQLVETIEDEFEK